MAFDSVAENLIRGIIVANSRTGITIEQIGKLFHRHTDEPWSMLNNGEFQAIEYLQQMNGVLSILNDKNERLWYVRGKILNSNSTGQIYRSNNHLKSSNFDLSTNPHGYATNTCPWNSRNGNKIHYNNNNNIGNGHNTKNNDAARNNNGYNDIGGNHVPQNHMQQKFHTNDRIRMNGHGYGSSFNNSPSRRKNGMLYDYHLVGDDFFMEMSKIDLGNNFTNQNRVQQSGLCISGQTIRDATIRIQRLPLNSKVIVNVGSVDILLGRESTDMCQDYISLVRLCDRRNIKIIITTLAPLANRLHCQADVRKWHSFNEFLKSGFNRYTVIDIVPSLQGKTGKVLFECYQADAKYITGSNQPHMLWNRIGRQRVLKKLKNELPLQ